MTELRVPAARSRGRCRFPRFHGPPELHLECAKPSCYLSRRTWPNKLYGMDMRLTVLCRRGGAMVICCVLFGGTDAGAQNPVPVEPSGGALFGVPLASGDAAAAPPVPPVPLVPADAAPKGKAAGLYDSLHDNDNYGLKPLFDSLHPHGANGKHWYEKLSIRGYTQFRFGRTLDNDPTGVPVSILGDRALTGEAEGFSVRRGRVILSGDVTDHLGLYAQVDAANTPPGSSTATMFAQMRDLYADVYIDATKVHRLRVGLSKVPFGFENLQSSQNRVPLDRTDPINSGVSPNERDLGVFYYWTPEDKQHLFRDLVDGGLKGSGNYGVFGLGVYTGQGGSQLEQNRNLHAVARLTWPVMLASGQVVEAGVQGYTGETVVAGGAIRPLGTGPAQTPTGTQATGDRRGHRDQRVAATFVWYPQPFGFQAEWNYGEGPGLSDDQRTVFVRPLQGGYVMAMYKHDTADYGIFTPYVRYQYYNGGYKSVVNAPFGVSSQWDLGVEWQIRKEMELVVEYNLLDHVSLTALDRANARSYRNFTGSALRVQFQVNY